MHIPPEAEIRKAELGAAACARLTREVEKHKPGVTLETGFCSGRSAVAIMAATTGPHHAIDPFAFSWWGGIGIEAVEAAGHRDRLLLHEEHSYAALPRLMEEGLSVDLAFVDGSHQYDHVFLEWFFVDHLLPAGGVVIFDDVGTPDVRQVIRYALSTGDYAVSGAISERLLLRGMAVLTKRRDTPTSRGSTSPYMGNRLDRLVAKAQRLINSTRRLIS